MTKYIKLVRTIVYEGSEAWVEQTLARSYVPMGGEIVFMPGKRLSSELISREEITNEQIQTGGGQAQDPAVSDVKKEIGRSTDGVEQSAVGGQPQ